LQDEDGCALKAAMKELALGEPAARPA
jgi:hypothetical protein